MPICGVMGDYELFDYFLDFNLVAQALAGVQAGFPFPADYQTAVTAMATLAFLGAGYTNRSEGPFGKVVGDGIKFLKETETVNITFNGTDIIAVTIPITVELKVVETPPGIRGEGAALGAGALAIRQSVVKINPAMEPAFCNASRVTLAGSNGMALNAGPDVRSSVPLYVPSAVLFAVIDNHQASPAAS